MSGRLALLVAAGAGAGLGAACRFGLALALAGQAALATLIANVVGAALIGFYAAMTGPDGLRPAGPVERHFVMAGFCGGFTTFSIFTLDMLAWLAEGRGWLVAGWLALSLPAWVGACLGGMALGARVTAARSGRSRPPPSPRS